MVKLRFRQILFVILSILFLLPISANAKVLKKADTDKKRIALTFDDGPSKSNTAAILNVLKEYEIQATFFVIGENAEKDPDRIRSIFDAGHEIGNHTYSHIYISKVPESTLRNEIEKTENILMKITGEKPHVFRPPGGFYNDASLAVLDSLGYKCVLWSVDTRDWSMPKSDNVATQVQESATKGDIILFHDLEDKRLPTVAALKRIIPYLIENGYEFVTVSELFENEAD
ncbi:MAG: polysaccharide deacetylase family protein [Clostridia bacterium]|nr:polysaccharide deacetylase family protein [Clostridia bacterium]